MEVREIVEKAVQLTPPERARVIDALLCSLDQPDARIDSAWGEEAEARLQAIRDGRLATVPADQVLKPR
jgi:putative addiction module component (TIGR02574 family)